MQRKKSSTICNTSNAWLIVERGRGRIKGLGGCSKLRWGWLIVERGWGRVKGLGGGWKFKWGWLIVSMYM